MAAPPIEGSIEVRVATLIERSIDHERRIAGIEGKFWAIILLTVSTLITGLITLSRIT